VAASDLVTQDARAPAPILGDLQPPALILVQASSRSWAGGEDFCLRELDGAPAVAHTIAAAQRRFPGTHVCLLAPEFDRGGRLAEIAQEAAGEVRMLYGFDASPLDRMLMATCDLADGEYVLRVDGLHFAADFDLAATMLARARRRDLDAVKTPDDFPPQLSVDVLRVGAMRRARALVAGAHDPFLVHPKLLLASHPAFRFEYQDELPRYSDEQLLAMRGQATKMLSEVERLEVGGRGRISSGDQLSYHYELALGHLRPADRVLDVACGAGFGVRMLAGRCAGVVGVDLDEQSIAAARAADPDRAGAYVVADATHMPFADCAFEAVVSFETLEHVPQLAFLREVRRVLAPGGLLLLSTPQNRLGHIPFTPAHEHEFSLEELTDLVGAHFEIVQRIGLKAGTIWFAGDPTGTNSFFVCRRG
jgi:2-polyprenyl-3-methyl-5-hydroxy-6-metoxy-1,4-benzoquinol methylase